jgi:anti-anti-sigma factor
MLEGRLQELIPEFRRIVLDLSSVEYIDNSGVALLANVYARARQADCDLEIGNPKRRLRDRVRNWLDSALQGHEEYLGVTPD